MSRGESAAVTTIFGSGLTGQARRSRSRQVEGQRSRRGDDRVPGGQRRPAMPKNHPLFHVVFNISRRTPLCRLCGRLDDLISEPTRAVGATVTEGTVVFIGLPRMAR